MPEMGFTLSSEEQQPAELARIAALAEDAGFSFVTISDHFHPWTSQQGNSPFVWAVLGAIAGRTERIRVGTAVTCPIVRIHPAIVAHAAATVAAMMPGRFFLGLGTGENLNEHVTGHRWPSASERRDLLVEAVDVIASSGRATSSITTAPRTTSSTHSSTRVPKIHPPSTSPRRARSRRPWPPRSGTG
jgi:G6PDH family F420-dependent oxidoreductase